MWIYPELFKRLKNGFMYVFSIVYRKIKFPLKRIYRLLNAKKASHFVWLELIKCHKGSNWKFGQYDHEKNIKCSFIMEDDHSVVFNYTVQDDSLNFSSILLNNFDENLTNDILVLASHFNGLLNYGMVKVSLKYNYVEYVYKGDSLTYALFPADIRFDTDLHYNLTKDCYWAFTTMITTGEDPVFVFSELLRNKENNNTNDVQNEN